MAQCCTFCERRDGTWTGVEKNRLVGGAARLVREGTQCVLCCRLGSAALQWSRCPSCIPTIQSRCQRVAMWLLGDGVYRFARMSEAWMGCTVLAKDRAHAPGDGRHGGPSWWPHRCRARARPAGRNGGMQGHGQSYRARRWASKAAPRKNTERREGLRRAKRSGCARMHTAEAGA